MSTLYRDYRPQNFTEILGQNHIKITLQNEISTNKLAQAFLFCGPRAVGKTTLARVLAKTVNCLERKENEYEPCNKCINCISTTQGKNLDVVEVDAASNTGVDNVRDNIINFSRLLPMNSKFKVFIIDEVHMLSISAFNALLKIIEEPPYYIIFILCTTEIQKVPLTIISRCERFDFKRISVVDIVKKLSFIAKQEKINIDSEVLEAVARRSGGHLRDAESLLGQIFALGDNNISLAQAELVIPHYNSHEAVSLLEYLNHKDVLKGISLINNLVDNGVSLKNFTAELIGLLRKIILNKVNPSLPDSLGLNLGESLETRINLISNSLSWDQLLIFTKRFLEAYNDNRNTLIPQLPLELALIDLCYAQSFKMSSETNNSGILPKNNSQNVSSLKVQNVDNRVIDNREELRFNNSKLSESNKKIINLNQTELAEKWPEFLVKIKKYNHSLSFVLQNCQPQDIKNNCLCLIFKYKFHQDRINDAAIKNIVETTLAEVFGATLSLNLVIDENLEIKHEEKKVVDESSEIELSKPSTFGSAGEAETNIKKGGLIGDLLKTFGGEIIN